MAVALDVLIEALKLDKYAQHLWYCGIVNKGDWDWDCDCGLNQIRVNLDLTTGKQHNGHPKSRLLEKDK